MARTACGAAWCAVAEVTSPSVGRDAARLLRVKTLRPDHLAAVHRVAASALTQRGEKSNRRALTAAFGALDREIQQPPIPPATQRRLLAALERLGAILFPAKS